MDEYGTYSSNDNGYTPPPQPPKKSFGPGKFVIALVAVVIVAAIVGGVMLVIGNRPMNVIANAFEKSLDKAQDGELAGTLADALEGGSLEISGDLQKIAESLGVEGIDASVSLKLYTDIKKAAVAAVSSLKVDGAEVLDLSAFLDEHSVVVNSDALLGQAYGVNIDKIEENFDSSEFGEDGAYAMGITYEDIEEYLGRQRDNEKAMKDFERVVEKVWDAFAKSAAKHAEITTAGGSIDFPDKTVRTKDITITVDEEALADIAKDVLEFIKKDKSLKKFLDDNASMLSMDEDAVDDFYDRIDTTLDEIDDAADEMGEFKLTAIVSVAHGEIIGVDVNVKVEDYKALDFTFTCGPTWKKISEMKLSVKAPMNMTITYSVDENTNKQYSADITAKTNGQKVVDADIEWDKSSGDLTVKVKDLDFSFSGNFKMKRGETTLILGSIKVAEEKVDLGDVTVTLRDNDKIPSAPEYTDVLTMSEEDLEKVKGDIEEALKELAEKIEPLAVIINSFGNAQLEPPIDDDYGGDIDW